MLIWTHGGEDWSSTDPVPTQRTTTWDVMRRRRRRLPWDRFFDTTAHVTTKRKGTDKCTQSTDILVSSTLAIVGQNTCLMLLSILLVKGVYAVFFPKDKSEEQPVGIMNRCPWPFVISHDPKQFLKDSPTWMIVTWIALRRILKAVKSGPVVG
eukprot:scaffold1598_cov192-Amphora_coffeaeformis.AAC.1